VVLTLLIIHKLAVPLAIWLGLKYGDRSAKSVHAKEPYDSVSRIHDYTISLRFLGTIMRVFRLEVSVWIPETIGRGVHQVYLLSSFTVYNNWTEKLWEVAWVWRNTNLKAKLREDCE
jgi:hypothetical protein